MTYRGRCAGRRADGMRAHRTRRLARQWWEDWNGINGIALRAVGLVRLPAAESLPPGQQAAAVADLEAQMAEATAELQAAHATLTGSKSRG